METQRQTNGDVIMVGGQKPMLDNSIDRDGSLSMPMMLIVPITINPEIRSILT